MRVLAIVHGRWRRGAQEATLEMFKLLRRRGVDINVLISESAEKSFRSDIGSLEIPTYSVPGKTVANYPDLAVENQSELVKSSDLVWITDIEYLVAPRIKRIRKDIPVVAHLHSYAVACPIWTGFYGMREACTENCSHSLERFARCKQLSREYRARWGQKKISMKLYQLLNFPKSYVDFTRWPMNEEIVGSIDGFVAVSSYIRDLVRIHLPQVDNVPVEVVPNPVMVPELSVAVKNDDRPQGSILYASGSSIQKGPHLALYALRKLLDEGSNELTLTMLDTEENAWIESIVKRLGLEKQVRLLSRLPRTQVSSLMANSAMVLSPSLEPESFGRVPVEANLLGTPAIVSDRGALPSTIVDRVTGLVSEASVDAIAEAIDETLKTVWDRGRIARTARERFDSERTVDSLESFMHSCIRERSVDFKKRNEAINPPYREGDGMEAYSSPQIHNRLYTLIDHNGLISLC